MRLHKRRWHDHDAERAKGDAHEAFLRVAHGATDLIGKHIAFQLKLIDELTTIGRHTAVTVRDHRRHRRSRSKSTPESDRGDAGLALTVPKCLEFAVGSIGAVLGPDFAEIDRFPTRVRLPDEPLMLVDRILSVEGQPRSLQSGRVVTEHVIEPGAWYLDGGRIAPCIAIEAGPGRPVPLRLPRN